MSATRPLFGSRLIVFALLCGLEISACGEPALDDAGNDFDRAAPQLDAIFPPQGPTAGGINLSISGTNFATGATVTMAGEAARDVTVWSGTRITASLPNKPGFWGNVEVIVQNPDGKRTARSDLFSYSLGTFPFRSVLLDPGFSATAAAAGDFNGDRVDDLVVTGGLGVTIFLSDGAGGYKHNIQLSTGAGPVAVATGDLNGDGRLDAVVVNRNSNDVCVLLNDGLGNLTGMNYATGLGPTAVAILDWNGDKALDLAITNSDGNSVSIFLGSGTGTFAPVETIAVGTKPGLLQVADWNLDGKSDLAVLNQQDGSISILISDGNGAALSNIVPTTPASSVAQADWNADGKPDLIVVSASANDVSVYFGEGRGGFSSTTQIAASPSSFVAAADWNDDGKPDLAIAGKLLFGDGTGGISGSTSHSCSAYFANGDFNSDRRRDLICPSGNKVKLLLNDGAGALGESNPPLNVSWYFEEDPAEMRAMATADVNGDELLDIIIYRGYGPYFTLFYGIGNGRFSAPRNFSFTEPFGRPDYRGSFVVGDFNGDGNQDLAFAYIKYKGSNIGVLLGDGLGSFASPIYTPIGSGYRIALAAADLNGDQKLDLAIARSGTFVMSSYLGDGAGSFTWVGSYTVDATTRGGDGATIAVADFNGDSKLDVAVGGRYSDWVSLYLGQGTGGFSFSKKFFICSASALAASDLNGDGFADLVASSFCGGGMVLLGNETGLSTQGNIMKGNGHYSVQIGDFNADHEQDILLLGPPTLFWGDGSGNFTSATSFLDFMLDGVAADFDKDQKTDLVVEDNRSIYVWRNINQ